MCGGGGGVGEQLYQYTPVTILNEFLHVYTLYLLL